MLNNGAETMRSVMGEVKLYDNNKERNRLEDLADFYAIIKTTESLEAAYSRDATTPEEYADNCKRLISQFKTAESALISGKAIVSAEQFISEFQIDCPRAYERLIVSGIIRRYFSLNIR
jgi:ESCRT-I complex subunit VPS28